MPEAGNRLIGPGVFVPVVGPSGSGKDSLISYAARRLAGHSEIHFATRVITRPADPGSEAHDTLDKAAFEAAEAEGAFALSWRSHGLCYGIPVAVDETIISGGVVVANGSRDVVATIEARYARVIPVLVSVTPDVLAERLAGRGRETASEIEARLARNVRFGGFGAHCNTIDNSGALEDAGERFVELLLKASAPLATA